MILQLFLVGSTMFISEHEIWFDSIFLDFKILLCHLGILCIFVNFSTAITYDNFQ